MVDLDMFEVRHTSSPELHPKLTWQNDTFAKPCSLPIMCIHNALKASFIKLKKRILRYNDFPRSFKHRPAPCLARCSCIGQVSRGIAKKDLHSSLWGKRRRSQWRHLSSNRPGGVPPYTINQDPNVAISETGIPFNSFTKTFTVRDSAASLTVCSVMIGIRQGEKVYVSIAGVIPFSKGNGLHPPTIHTIGT